MVPTWTGKWENIFQLWKNPGFCNGLEKSGNFTQNTGKSGNFTQNTGKSGNFNQNTQKVRELYPNTGQVREICQSENVGNMQSLPFWFVCIPQTLSMLNVSLSHHSEFIIKNPYMLGQIKCN